MSASKFSNLGKRAGSGAVFVLFTAACIWFNEFSFLFAFGIFMLGSLFEFYKLKKITETPFYVLGILLGTALFTFTGFSLLKYVDMQYILYVIPVMLFATLAATFSKSRRSFTDLGTMYTGLIYAAFPFISFQFVSINSNGEYDNFPILLFLFIVWMNDSMAYLTGKLIGKTRLAKNISPGKTLEGTLGGLIFSFLLAIGVSQLFTSRSIIDIVVIWFSGSVLAVLGDLSESKLKRGVNVKNSGKFLPGHGGFLDRFDSLLLSGPFLMVYYLLVKA